MIGNFAFFGQALCLLLNKKLFTFYLVILVILLYLDALKMYYLNV